MPDLLFTDSQLAALYDRFAPSEARGDFSFYLPRIMAAETVLDVGCGTGALLHFARERGHQGRLCGLDPARGMLEQARKRSDIEWLEGDMSSVSWEAEFDLIVMSGHAFQTLVDDSELQIALAAICSALKKNGQFAFETRNPLAREWERWGEQYSGQVIDDMGTVVHSQCEVEMPVADDGLVRFSHAFTSAHWHKPLVSHSILRFLSTGALASFLTAAGLSIERQFGDWDHSPLDDMSPEIITIARKTEV